MVSLLVQLLFLLVVIFQRLLLMNCLFQYLQFTKKFFLFHDSNRSFLYLVIVRAVFDGWIPFIVKLEHFNSLQIMVIRVEQNFIQVAYILIKRLQNISFLIKFDNLVLFLFEQ
jgi:hypothetical protein